MTGMLDLGPLLPLGYMAPDVQGILGGLLDNECKGSGIGPKAICGTSGSSPKATCAKYGTGPVTE